MKALRYCPAHIFGYLALIIVVVYKHCTGEQVRREWLDEREHNKCNAQTIRWQNNSVDKIKCIDGNSTKIRCISYSAKCAWTTVTARSLSSEMFLCLLLPLRDGCCCFSFCFCLFYTLSPDEGQHKQANRQFKLFCMLFSRFSVFTNWHPKMLEWLWNCEVGHQIATSSIRMLTIDRKCQFCTSKSTLFVASSSNYCKILSMWGSLDNWNRFFWILNHSLTKFCCVLVKWRKRHQIQIEFRSFNIVGKITLMNDVAQSSNTLYKIA